MVNFYIYYNIYIYIYTPVLTGIEIYCSTNQTGIVFDTRLTPLDRTLVYRITL